MYNLKAIEKILCRLSLWMKKLYGLISFDIRNGAEYRKWKKFLYEKKSMSL